MTLKIRKDHGPENYFICTIQRSGKSWLCALLTRLQHLGAPEEYLRGIGRQKKHVETFDSLQEYFLSLRDHAQKANREKTGSDQPIGLAIQLTQLNLLAEISGIRPEKAFRLLQDAFNNPILFYLQREDIAAQAVSHYFLDKTGIAHSYQKNSALDETYINCEYSYEKILRWYNFNRDSYRKWDEIFANLKLSPRVIKYENLLDDMVNTISDMARHINNQVTLSPENILSASRGDFQKLVFPKKMQFIEQFRKDLEKEQQSTS
jgi:LPS sulfotransferase NodH